MSTSTVETTSSGIGFFGLLAILFIGLKLGGVINWSWWWVTAPLWGGIAFVVGIILSVVVAAILRTAVEAAWRAIKS